MTDMNPLQNSKKKIVITPKTVEEWREQLFDGQMLKIDVEQLRNWPLNYYLWACVFQAIHLDEGREPRDANWQTPAWDFGRFAKAHPELINLDENRALKRIKAAIGSSFWAEHLQMEAADAEMAFDHIWVECRAIPGYDPLKIAALEAKRAGHAQNADLPAGYDVFLATARVLQRIVGERPFLLPCHKLAPLLSCQPMTISRYRRKAIRDGYLTIVKDHSFHSSAKGEATEFIFLEASTRSARAIS